MAKREIAALACKILGLYTAVVSIGPLLQLPLAAWYAEKFTQSSGMLQMFPDPPALVRALVAMLPWLIQAGVGALLWIFAEALAIAMVGQESEATSHSNVNAQELKAIAFAVIGLLTLVQAVARLSNPSASFYRDGIPIVAVSTIVQTALGLWLVLGSRRIVGMIQAIPEAGLRPVAPPPDSDAESRELDETV